MKKINAAIGIILDDKSSKVYITLRQKHQTYSNYWEFPGGKVEKDETFIECIKRELYEEVGILVKSINSFFKKKYINKDSVEVNLEFFIIDKFENKPHPKEKQQLELVEISKLKKYKFLPASLEIIDRLQVVYS
ncbi:8-oxo-dGTP diphosphatase [Allofrancisella inopinata]|uniref:8-oxo-dGTP diphosphatase n=1 Tax=Allofrancisella inopinata TaxID=1085647 RepID=A0AAE6YIC8_9GAMM|nr:8-oxo-dGTP diphosphatase MutT [Allofrancisella inopinata]QIV96056.1 8-oxo-dGTP diphosphatase MutT [Allofrancisella inopinata]TDT71714.1 8-oxo-dGTP diphosphatase [Allofrancisella inopinata]